MNQKGMIIGAGLIGALVGAGLAALALQGGWLDLGARHAQVAKENALLKEGSPVLAEVGEKKIYESDLAAAIAQRDAMDLFEIRSRALDTAVEETLLETEAAKKGTTVQRLLKNEVDDKVKPVTDAEVKAFYDQQKNRMGGKTLDEVKKDIKGMLAERNKDEARSSLLSKLRAETKVKINLEPPRIEVATDGQPFRGAEDALVTVVEFTDYQCPFCNRAQDAILQILDEYKGKVKHVVRDFPLSFHQFAFKAHEAALCAGDQGKYWDMNKKLFSSQQDLKEESLKKYAGELGLNQKKFDSCLSSGKFKEQIEKNLEAGQAAGVTGTPAFFVNGIMISGARPFNSFKEIIDRELERKSQDS